MLMLRLQRIGRRNEAHFKIVVIEKSKGPKSQKYVDIVGSYNPKLGRVIIDAEKAKTHLSNGVQPSDTVRNMLISQGILEGRKVNNLPQKSPVIDEEKIAREKAEAEEKAAKAAEEKAAAEEAAKAEAEAQEETPAEEKTEDSTETAEEPAAEVTEEKEAE
ncbi:MAG: 30S ribosomal protein S16 [Minisyncoccia bacterium]